MSHCFFITEERKRLCTILHSSVPYQINEFQNYSQYLITLLIQMKWKQLRKILTKYNEGLCIRGSVGQTDTQTGRPAHEHKDSCLRGKGRCLGHTLLSQLLSQLCQPLAGQCLASGNVGCRFLLFKLPSPRHLLRAISRRWKKMALKCKGIRSLLP